MEPGKNSSWTVDEHLERSGVGAGKRSMMMVQDLPGELEAATVVREKQHVHLVLRHQPAMPCLAGYYRAIMCSGCSMGGVENL